MASTSNVEPTVASTANILHEQPPQDNAGSNSRTTRCKSILKSYWTAMVLAIIQIASGIAIITIWSISIKDTSLYIAPQGRFIAPGVLAIISGILAVARANVEPSNARGVMTFATFVLSLFACASAVYVCVADGKKIAAFHSQGVPSLLLAVEAVSICEAVTAALQVLVSMATVWMWRQMQTYPKRPVIRKARNRGAPAENEGHSNICMETYI